MRLPRLTLEEIRGADALELFTLMEQYANVADEFYELIGRMDGLEK